MNTTKIPVHVMIDVALTESKASVGSVAKALGYEKGNVISMFRAGTLKVPLNKIPALARQINLDPSTLMRATLNEYSPGLLEALEDTFGLSLSAAERKLVEFVRHHAQGHDIDVLSSTEVSAMLQLAAEALSDEATREDIESLPGFAKAGSQIGAYNLEMQKLTLKHTKERERLRQKFFEKAA